MGSEVTSAGLLCVRLSFVFFCFQWKSFPNFITEAVDGTARAAVVLNKLLVSYSTNVGGQSTAKLRMTTIPREWQPIVFPNNVTFCDELFLYKNTLHAAL